MPSVQEHVDQAKANRKFIDDLDLNKPTHVQWAVTCAFYAALHFIEALFASENPPIHNRGHLQRKRAINSWSTKKTVYKNIRSSYSLLKGYSEDARYDCVPFTRAQFHQDVLPHLQYIEAEARGALPPGTF